MSRTKPYEVGQEIETMCTRCKRDMIHVITAIKDNHIKKVMCKGCLTTHVYRESSNGERPKAGVRGKTETRKRKVTRRRKRDWVTLVADVQDSDVTDYKITGDYDVNQAIRHKTFGVGVITKILADNKIEVVFQDDTKILAQNWS